MPLNILYIVFHNYADLPYHTREWIEAAIALGHQVTLATCVDPGFLRQIGWDTPERLPGPGALRVHQVPYPGSIPPPWRYLALAHHFRHGLARIIQGNRPDIVYERFSILADAGSAMARRHGIPYGVEFNGIPDQELPEGLRTVLKRRVQAAIERRVLARCTAAIAVTGQIRDWLVAERGAPRERTVVIPNGVNPQRFSPRDQAAARQAYGVPQDAFVVGFLGSLFPWQNLPILVDVAPGLIAAIPNFFCMIGGGQEPMLSQLRALVRERGLQDRFSLPGQIPWDKAAEFIACFDAGIAPVWKEGYEFSLQKLVAYMACERMLIATDASGIRDVITAAQAGITFVFQDADDLARQVVAAARMPAEERAAHGQRGREYVLRHLSWESLVRQTLDMIQLSNLGNTP